MFKKKKNLSGPAKMVYSMQTVMEKWNKRRKHWKRRFYLLVVFPVFLVACIIRGVRTYVRIKLWEMGTSAPSPFTRQEK